MGVKVKERKGAWWLFIDHKGLRKAKRVGTGKPGKKAADLAAIQIQAKLASGDKSVFEETRAKAVTLQEYAEGWLKNYVAVQRKPGTSEKYDTVLRKHWFPTLGRLPLTGLTREGIKGVLADKLGGKLKPRPVKGHLDVLRACFSVAVEDQLILANPAARLGRFVIRSGETREVETFTRAELTVLLETTRDARRLCRRSHAGPFGAEDRGGSHPASGRSGL